VCWNQCHTKQTYGKCLKLIVQYSSETVIFKKLYYVWGSEPHVPTAVSLWNHWPAFLAVGAAPKIDHGVTWGLCEGIHLSSKYELVIRNVKNAVKHQKKNMDLAKSRGFQWKTGVIAPKTRKAEVFYQNLQILRFLILKVCIYIYITNISNDFFRHLIPISNMSSIKYLANL